MRFEHKPEAYELLKRNKDQFQLSNIAPVFGSAPQVLVDLPAPDRVFLGGTSGAMQEILTAAIRKNPDVRVVATAVTLETLYEAMGQFEAMQLSGVEMTQVNVAHTKKTGGYHMMQANNPVWIISGGGRS